MKEFNKICGKYFYKDPYVFNLKLKDLNQKVKQKFFKKIIFLKNILIIDQKIVYLEVAIKGGNFL
jgi:hypothetical protein